VDELTGLWELVPQFGLWVVFLWLYLRESKERRETETRLFAEIKEQLRHIDRTEAP
jgi:hypothetical protein